MRRNQFVIDKAFRCINALLSNEETHLTMKIAMGVNRPEMQFLEGKGKLRPFLADSMNELLYFMIQS